MDSQKDNVQFLFQMQGRIWMLKYGSFLLIILFITNLVLHYRDNRRNTREKDDLTKELNHLKAKLYDAQQGKK
jgi:hypothetical protein